MFFRLLLSSVSCGTKIQSYIIPFQTAFCSTLDVTLSVQPVVTLVSINTLAETH